MTTREEFLQFQSHQYCDTPTCTHYGLVGKGNIKIKSSLKQQLYCNVCKKMFVARKGTMFFGLRTPIDKVVGCLSLLASGMGVNAVCRDRDVTADSLRSWIILASKHVNEFTAYMQQGMHLEQVQIDEFWSFIQKKMKI